MIPITLLSEEIIGTVGTWIDLINELGAQVLESSCDIFSYQIFRVKTANSIIPGSLRPNRR
jgi:hypothetical protein